MKTFEIKAIRAKYEQLNDWKHEIKWINANENGTIANQTMNTITNNTIKILQINKQMRRISFGRFFSFMYNLTGEMVVRRGTY